MMKMKINCLRNYIAIAVVILLSSGCKSPSLLSEEKVALPEEAEELATSLWANLNEDNKVSLFVRAIDLATGETEDVIINKYDAVCDEE